MHSFSKPPVGIRHCVHWSDDNQIAVITGVSLCPALQPAASARCSHWCTCLTIALLFCRSRDHHRRPSLNPVLFISACPNSHLSLPSTHQSSPLTINGRGSHLPVRSAGVPAIVASDQLSRVSGTSQNAVGQFQKASGTPFRDAVWSPGR